MNYNFVIFFSFLIKRKFIFILSIILILNERNISFSKLVSPKYNFGNQQNPEIDKLYKHLQGRNIYFITDDPEKTLFIIIIYPENNLKIGLKMYTDSELLINSLNSGKKLFFGVDLVVNNTDIFFPDFNTDIVICNFDLNDTNCNDYVFDLTDNYYKINKNGDITNNNLIPINFELVELNLLKQNVMEYKNYYCVDFIKNYTKYFDSIYMINYFLFSAMKMNRSIIGFYGVVVRPVALDVGHDVIIELPFRRRAVLESEYCSGARWCGNGTVEIGERRTLAEISLQPERQIHIYRIG